MNMRRQDIRFTTPRYRSGGSLSLLNSLLQESAMETLLPPVLNGTSEPVAAADWLPAVDIKEEAERFVLRADLPGVDPENIEVTMADGVLTIQGSRASESNDADGNYQRYERVTGRFVRRFTLPETANAENIAALTKHGVLEVSIPKQAKPQPRKISVQTS